MARIIIAPARFAGPEFEVEQSVFDAGFYPGYVYVSDATPAASSEATAEEQRVAGFVSGGTVLPAALRAAYVPFWTAAETVTTGTVRVDATGHLITANSNRTTRSSYDVTEQAAWTVVSGGGGAVASVNGHTGTVSLAAADVNADPAGAAAGMALIFGA